MSIDNSTALLFSAIIPNLNYITPFIAVIIGGLIGYLVSLRSQTSNNMRQKVIEVDKSVFSDLRSWVKQTLRCLNDHDFFDWTYTDIRIRDTIHGDNFERIVLKSDIYEKKNESLILSYKKNKILNRHSPRIIECSEAYCDNFEKLEKIVKDINYEKYYDSLERGIAPLLFHKGRNIADLKNLQNQNHSQNKNLQLILLSILFDNPRLFPNGTAVRLDLLNTQFEETQKVVFQNQDLEVIAENISKIRDNLIINLEGMQTELKNLHNDWRNYYHI